MNVVIADDSRAMRMIVRKTIRDAGYPDAEVREAENGAKALEIVKQWRPHLVMTDWNMPEMGGLDLLKALGEHGYRGAAGVVSSSASPEMRTEAMDAGARFVIQKPFTARVFQDAIRLTGFEPTRTVEHDEIKTLEMGLHIEGLTASLSGAYKRKLTIAEIPPIRLRRMKTAAYATYEQNGQVTAVCAMDVECAAALACALSLIPAHTVKSIVADNAFSDEVRGNLGEVFNLFSRILGTEERAANLANIEIGEMPLFVRATARKGTRCDARVEVDGYGAGNVCLARSS